MHSMDISHNDIKPDNIFFKLTYENPLTITYRISDFGFCSNSQQTNKLRGTRDYFSPELQVVDSGHSGATSNTFSNDAYALAFTCILVLSTQGDENVTKALEYIKSKPQKVVIDNQNEINLETLLQFICVSDEQKRLHLFENDLKKILNA